MPQKILVTGANGQLGKEFRLIADQYPGFIFLFLSREDLAIHHFELVRNFFRSYHPDICINCAAYTAVDKAETEPDLANLVNAESTGVLAAVCREFDARLIHISTDYVFSGNALEPYKESDPTDPQSVYGSSKREGEVLALQFNPQTMIFRTSWVYSVYGKNFVKTMIRLMKEKPVINVVNDQWGSPTHAADLAKCIMDILASGKFVPGIYHFSNDGIINWFQFAEAIKELTGSHCELNPIPTSAYPTPAKRPAYSVMSKEKIKDQYNIILIPWKKSLADCISILDSKKEG
jgi:dTDP-4-dehydrorhamnose reductase